MKMMIIGRRRSGTTLKQLHAYMVEQHGQIVLGYIRQEPSKAPQRYVQNHAIDGFFANAQSHPGQLSQNRDFVTQVWFDSMPAALASLEQPFYLEQLRPDEDKFVEQTSVIKLPVNELIIKPFDSSIAADRDEFKVFLLLKRSTGVAQEKFSAAYSAYAIAFNQQVPSMASQVQCNVMHRPDQEAPVDIVQETWFSSLEHAYAGLATMKALAKQFLITPALVDEAGLRVSRKKHVLVTGAHK